MRCEILTLFPDIVRPVLDQSMMRRAQEKGLLHARVRNLRDFTQDAHQVADDAPYGGGAGMVMKAEPIFQAVEAVTQEHELNRAGLRLLLPTPQGRRFSQAMAEELRDDHRVLVFLCGHYEGIDERIRIGLAPEEVSIGDYVLTGGELPALVMIDAAVRLVPGVVGDPTSLLEESFVNSLLDYPHYTRPSAVRGLMVPNVLLSGNHEQIRVWRRKESLRNTYLKRPDLLPDRMLSEEDKRLLEEIVQEKARHTSVPCGEED
jgi:tRNA (guanine37-N1)-methyltransferase